MNPEKSEKMLFIFYTLFFFKHTFYVSVLNIYTVLKKTVTVTNNASIQHGTQIKKKIKFYSYMVKYLRMTLHPIPSEFPYLQGEERMMQYKVGRGHVQ